MDNGIVVRVVTPGVEPDTRPLADYYLVATESPETAVSLARMHTGPEDHDLKFEVAGVMAGEAVAKFKLAPGNVHFLFAHL